MDLPNHIPYKLDPETGEFVRAYGGQGYTEGSSWTRGQGWGVYGFMISYIHTGKQEYFDTAKRIAHYIMANIPDSGILQLISDSRRSRHGRIPAQHALLQMD